MSFEVGQIWHGSIMTFLTADKDKVLTYPRGVLAKARFYVSSVTASQQILY